MHPQVWILYQQVYIQFYSEEIRKKGEEINVKRRKKQVGFKNIHIYENLQIAKVSEKKAV